MGLGWPVLQHLPPPPWLLPLPIGRDLGSFLYSLHNARTSTTCRALGPGTQKVPGKALACRGAAQGFHENVRQGRTWQRSSAWGSRQRMGPAGIPRAHSALGLGQIQRQILEALADPLPRGHSRTKRMGRDMGAHAGTWVRSGPWGHAGQSRTPCPDGSCKVPAGVKTRQRQGRGRELGLFTRASWVFCMRVMDLPISLLLLKTPDPRSPLWSGPQATEHQKAKPKEKGALEKTHNRRPPSKEEIQQGNHEVPLSLLHKELPDLPPRGWDSPGTPGCPPPSPGSQKAEESATGHLPRATFHGALIAQGRM